jgi:hypothetical protein
MAPRHSISYDLIDFYLIIKGILTMRDLTDLLCESLNSYIFSNVYNEPVNEYRVNVKPHMVNKRSVSGGFSLNDGTYINLPTSYEAYYVYTLHRETIHGLITSDIPKTEWLSCVDLCNNHDILVHVYTPNGKLLPKGSSYIRWACDESLAHLVITKQAGLLLGTHDQMANMYVTLYRDSDVVNKIRTYSYHTPTVDNSYIERQKVWNTIFDAAKANIPYNVFINGFEVKVKELGDLPLNAYIDVVTDENVVFEFDLNLQDVVNNVGFFSDIDKTYKQLVHIPKALNPDNKILTHNTVEIFVRSNEENKGVYLHRCAERTVTQVTHNDLAIPMFIVDATRDYLDTQNITLHVMVRQHVNDNVLIRDKNYIDLLYSDHHDDAAIIQHLLGNISTKLDFWKASELEKSTYVGMMFDVPNWFTPKNVWGYVEGLGYYHTISLLCKRVIHSTITDWFIGSYNFPKPYLYANEDVYPVVYLNGFKVKWEHVTVSNDTPNKTAIGFTAEVPWKIGDTMSVEMFISTSNNIYAFTPINGDNKITVPYTDITYLEKVEPDYPVKSYERTDNVAYHKLTSILGNIIEHPVDGGTEVTFGPLMFGKTFIIQNKLTTYRFSKKLDSDMLLGNPLVLDLEKGAIDGQGLNVPIYDTSFIGVFLNSRHLVPGVDYHILENYDSNGDLVIKQVVLQNMKYLKVRDNWLEVIISSAKVDNETYGFVVEDRADTEEDDVTIFFDTLSTFHVDGRLETDVKYRGAYFNLEEDKYENGVPFHVRTSVPPPVKDFIDRFHTNDDHERIVILNTYFWGNLDKRPSMIIQDMPSHQIFSSHMITVLRDILAGTFSPIAIDPDINKLLLSLKKYEKFYKNDVVYKQSANKHFVDAYPSYRNYSITDPHMLKYINDLVKAVMPKDNITSGYNVYP